MVLGGQQAGEVGVGLLKVVGRDRAAGGLEQLLAEGQGVVALKVGEGRALVLGQHVVPERPEGRALVVLVAELQTRGRGHHALHVCVLVAAGHSALQHPLLAPARPAAAALPLHLPHVLVDLELQSVVVDHRDLLAEHATGHVHPRLHPLQLLKHRQLVLAETHIAFLLLVPIIHVYRRFRTGASTCHRQSSYGCRSTPTAI